MTGIAVHDTSIASGNARLSASIENTCSGDFRIHVARLARALEMTEKPRQEPVALIIARRVEPGAIGRGAIDVVEARAAATPGS